MTLTIELMLTLAGSLITVVGFTIGIIRWALTELRLRDERIAMTDARAKAAEDALRASFDAYRVYAAEHFASGTSLNSAVDRVEEAVKRLTDRMDRYFEPIRSGA